MPYNTEEHIEQWFINAEKTAQELGHQLTAVVDLDLTLIENEADPHKLNSDKFSTLHVIVGQRKIGIDLTAFLELKAFCQRGHRIIVFTENTYSYDFIEWLFNMFDIALKREHYFNRRSMEKLDYRLNQKGVYIGLGSKLFDRHSILFDDNPNNRPQLGPCSFYHVKQSEPFPKLRSFSKKDEMQLCDEADRPTLPLLANGSPLAMNSLFARHRKTEKIYAEALSSIRKSY